MSDPFVRAHEEEPVLGMPERLPTGERLLWQGSPGTWRLLVELFHFRKIVFYFALVAIARIALQWNNSGTLQLGDWFMPLTFLASGTVLLWLLAQLYAKTTIYSITNRRIALRYGVAVPMVLNIPFAELTQASVQKRPRGCGNLAIEVAENVRLSWVVLWPNVRPWRYSKPQPLLRGIANVDEVASLLQNAVVESSTRAASADNIQLQPVYTPTLQAKQNADSISSIGNLGQVS